MNENESECEQFIEFADRWLAAAESERTKSFETLCRSFQPALRRFVQQRLSPKLQSQTAASDIMQSAFMSLWKRLESYSKPAGASTENLWRLLITIARRRLSRHWRKIHAQKRGEGRSFNAADLSDEERNGQFEEMVIASTNEQMEIELNDAVNQLESEQQAITSMRLSGMTIGEIAEALQCSKSRIERKNRLIHEKLRRLMTGVGDH